MIHIADLHQLWDIIQTAETHKQSEKYKLQGIKTAFVQTCKGQTKSFVFVCQQQLNEILVTPLRR